MTLVNRCAWDRVVGWHVSDVPSFSDHMYIRFQVKSRIRKQTKMFRNVRRTCGNKYVNELEQKLNERTLRPLGYRCLPQKKTLMCWQTIKVHSVITNSYEAVCPMRKSLRTKDNIWRNSELAAFGKRLAGLGEKPLKQNKKKIGRLKSSPYPASKKLSEKQSAIHGIAL